MMKNILNAVRDAILFPNGYVVVAMVVVVTAAIYVLSNLIAAAILPR
jgi:hypothetical protein